jgi:hypothetical protein
VFAVLNRKQRKSGKDIKNSDTDPFFARDIQIRENFHWERYILGYKV